MPTEGDIKAPKASVGPLLLIYKPEMAASRLAATPHEYNPVSMADKKSSFAQ